MDEAKTLTAHNRKSEATVFEFTEFQIKKHSENTEKLKSLDNVTSRLMVKVVWRFVRDVHDQLVVCHSRNDGTLKKTATENAARGPLMFRCG
jgi:hypothetical protein